jgi:hypothetical protein
MTSTELLPPTVRSAAIKVCRDALHWRDDLRAVFLTAGVPPSFYDKDDNPANSKAKIARYVLSDLQDRGLSGFVIQRKITEELCRMSKPHPDAPDQAAGKSALAELKREATTMHVLVDPEKAAADTAPFTPVRPGPAVLAPDVPGLTRTAVRRLGSRVKGNSSRVQIPHPLVQRGQPLNPCPVSSAISRYTPASRTASPAADSADSCSAEGRPGTVDTTGNDHHSGPPINNAPRRVTRRRHDLAGHDRPRGPAPRCDRALRSLTQ